MHGGENWLYVEDLLEHLFLLGQDFQAEIENSRITRQRKTSNLI